MKIYEAADLAPDTYEGEYFQPSVEVYKKNDVDEGIKKKDELLKEMAEALSQITEEVKKHAYNPSLEHMGPWVMDSENALQKYREQVGDTNAK